MKEEDDFLADLIDTYRDKLVPRVKRARKDGTVICFHMYSTGERAGKYLLNNVPLSSLEKLWGTREPPVIQKGETMLVVIVEQVNMVYTFGLNLHNLTRGGSA